MQARIQSALPALETQHGIRILYACVSSAAPDAAAEETLRQVRRAFYAERRA